MKRILRLSLVIVTIVTGGCQSPENNTLLTGHTMGTTYTVRITGCARHECGIQLGADIAASLESIEQRFSTYRHDSEISAFNRHASLDWYPVSAEFASLVKLAREVSDLSDGAFDITVAPAVNAWGFGPDAANTDPHTGAMIKPSAQQVRLAKAGIGYRNMQVRLSPPALRKAVASLSLDMSAIAKGYAVDQIAYLLERNGQQNYLVEIGGELRVAGLRPDGKAWRIGLEPPDNSARVEVIVLPGRNAVATSGDYRNYFEQDGKHYSHTINPASGKPVDQPLAAVSVIAPSAAQADALATALLVLGTERGLQLAERQGIAALFTERRDDRLHSQHSTAFAGYLLSAR